MQQLKLVEGLVRHTIAVLAAQHFFNLASLLVLRYSELHHITVCDGSSLQRWSGKCPCITVEALVIEIVLRVSGATLLVDDLMVWID